MTDHREQIDRRDFLRTSVGVAAGVTLSPQGSGGPDLISPLSDQAPLLFRAPPIPRVRIGFVGVGGQGSGHVETSSPWMESRSPRSAISCRKR
jgi:hypothetical protein